MPLRMQCILKLFVLAEAFAFTYLRRTDSLFGDAVLSWLFTSACYVVLLLLSSLKSNKPLEVGFEFSPLNHGKMAVTDGLSWPYCFNMFPCWTVKLMRKYTVSLRFSPIGAELEVSVRQWIILAPGCISHHPTGSSLLRLTGLTLIFTTSRGHSDPGWGINAKSCRNVPLSNFGIKVPLNWYIIQGSLCQQRLTKPCAHAHTHTQKYPATTVSSRKCLSPM